MPGMIMTGYIPLLQKMVRLIVLMITRSLMKTLCITRTCLLKKQINLEMSLNLKERFSPMLTVIPPVNMTKICLERKDWNTRPDVPPGDLILTESRSIFTKTDSTILSIIPILEDTMIHS